MARAATEAKATANDTSDVEAMISAEEETNAYERVLAVCENSISEYTNFLEVSWKPLKTMKDFSSYFKNWFSVKLARLMNVLVKYVLCCVILL